MKALASLKRFAKSRPAERCGLCGLELQAQHPHLLETALQKLVCTCEPCAILFSGVTTGKYRRVPKDTYVLQSFKIDDETWQAFEIPINMAFFTPVNGTKAVRAYYPSPAGPMESLLPMNAWERLVQDNPVLLQLEPEVETLLVNRYKDAREYYRTPIDICYKLVGIIRSKWRGFSGGAEFEAGVAEFFSDLKTKGQAV